MLVLAVGFMFVYEDSEELSLDRETARPSAEPIIESSTAAAQELDDEDHPKSVAVLPFENLSPDPNDEYFAAGIHEELLIQLAKIADISVISRISVLANADSGKSIPVIASELNVEIVLEGSVSYAGERVKITAQLIDAETNEHLWSEAYERDLTDIFGVQAEISENIALALEVELSDSERARIEIQPTESEEAYQAFLRARALYRDFEYVAAAAVLEQTLEIDPTFAAAHAELAHVYSSMVGQAIGGTHVNTSELGRSHAERAIELDPDLGPAYATLGSINVAAGNWDQAEQDLNRGFELSPGDSSVLIELVRFHTNQGNYTEGVRFNERAAQINPLNPDIRESLGSLYLIAGDLESSLREYRRWVKMTPSNQIANANLGLAESVAGNNSEALRYLRTVEHLGKINGTLTFVSTVTGYVLAGQPNEALRIMDQLNTFAEDKPVGEAPWVLAYSALGDHENSREHLRQLIEKPVPGIDNLILKTNAWRIPMLDEPEFVEARNQIELRGE